MPTADASTGCPSCGAPLVPGSLVCSQCQAMVHGARLTELAASARRHEESREFVAAHRDWRAMLELLPAASSQAAWVRSRLAELQNSAAVPAPKASTHPWARRLGPLAPLVLLLPKAKFLLAMLKLPFLLSFLSFAALYWALYGAKFGIGLTLLILIHELGHFVEVRRRGIAADLPMFIPGFGAYVRWIGSQVTVEVRAYVSLAGPLAGTAGAAACALIWLWTQQRIWIGLAGFSAFINLFNLVPVWTLDGSQAMAAINRSGRLAIAVAALLFAAYLSQPLLLLVAAVAAYRAFGREPALAQPLNLGVTLYFVLLLAALGGLSKLAPLGAGAH